MSSPADRMLDVAVIGAGSAGLSAAVTLARFGRSVLVIDDAHPRNAPAGHVHNFLTRDGAPPAELYRIGRAEAQHYGARFLDGTVRAIDGTAGAFQIRLDDRTIAAQRVIVATGGRDELPDVAGLAERWGRDVLHCPFCHGYEVRDQRIGVLATSPMAVHQAALFRLLSPHVTVLAHTAPPAPDAAAELAERGIAIEPGVVAEVLRRGDCLSGVRFADDRELALDAVVVAPVVHARADFLAPLGLHPVDVMAGEHRVATRIEAGPMGATAVPGIWIAGNATDPMAQVVSAAAAGLAVGAAIIADLIAAS